MDILFHLYLHLLIYVIIVAQTKKNFIIWNNLRQVCLTNA
jgi:hypothetical protein